MVIWMNRLSTISVCIVCWNHLYLTKETINSISISMDVPHEVLILDNDSTDGSKEWLDGFAEDILKNNTNFLGLTIIKAPSNRFISGGQNTLFLLACGKYLMFSASDILWPKDFASFAVK